LIEAHPLILFAVRPELLALLKSIQAPWRVSTRSSSCWRPWSHPTWDYREETD
jgi:hypothetical protein